MTIDRGRRSPTGITSPGSALGLLMIAAAIGCASPLEFSCRPGEKSVVAESLYFGTNKPGGVVTQEEWNSFVADVVTPAFPAGLTTWTASGQWRTVDGTIDRETSHILQLTHDDSARDDQAVQAIMARYKQDFQQQAVLRVRSRACVLF